MEEVTVIPNLGAVSNNEPVPVVPNSRETCENRRGCLTGHRARRRGPISRRSVRMAQAINFLLYGVTLMVPGVAMIIVYFVVFRIPAGNVRWSPADAFVITGAILVGFSIVSEVIGLWQFCMSRYESDEPSTDTTIQNNQYSDAPPSYDRIAVDLLDLVVVSVSQSTDENPPPFEACFPNNRPLPGLENRAFDSSHTDEDDLPPPPAYREAVEKKESPKRSSVIVNQNEGNVKFMTSENNSNESSTKDSK